MRFRGCVVLSFALLLLQPAAAGASPTPHQPRWAPPMGTAASQDSSAQHQTRFAVSPNYYVWYVVNAYGIGTKVKFTVSASATVDIMVMDKSQFSSFASTGSISAIFRQLTAVISTQIELPSTGTYYLVVSNDQSGVSVNIAVTYYTVPVDIYRQYSSVPVPTGIADYGVVNRSGTFSSYKLAATAVTGSAVLNSVAAYNASSPLGASTHGASLQLNVMMRVNTTSGRFVYWLQNVFSIYTDNHTAYFANNIWNYTTPNSRISGRVVTGSGSVYTAGSRSYYGDATNSSTYLDPLTLSIPISVSHSSNNVFISFGYREASAGQPLPGKTTFYDNVTISEFRGVEDAAIIVDGFEPNPGGTFYDAELVFGGQCCYASTTFTSMDSTLTMSYKLANGDSTAPRSIFEFGSDTAEGAYNLQTSLGQGGYHVGLGKIDFTKDYLLGPVVPIPLTFSYKVSDDSSPSAVPILSYVGNGTQVNAILTTSPKTIIADQGTPWAVTTTISGSGDERWVASGNTSGIASAARGLVVAYYHQTLVTASFAVNPGGQPPHPVLRATAVGAAVSSDLSQTNSSYWLDTGTQWSVTNPLDSSTSSQRWAAGASTSGAVSKGLYIHPVYFAQFLVTVTFEIQGGGSPGRVAVNGTSLGSAIFREVDASGAIVWVDSGSSLSAAPLTTGSSSKERWVASPARQWVVTAPFATSLVYRHEFHLIVQSSAPAGTIVSPDSGWFGPGSVVTLDASASSDWRFERWVGSGPASFSGETRTASFTVDGPVNETAVFYPGLMITVGSGGTVSYISGNATGSVGSGSVSVIYAAPGSPIVLTAQPALLQALRGWSGSASGGSETVVVRVDAPSQITATFGLNLVEAGGVTGLAILAVAAVLGIRSRGARPAS